MKEIINIKLGHVVIVTKINVIVFSNMSEVNGIGKRCNPLLLDAVTIPFEMDNRCHGVARSKEELLQELTDLHNREKVVMKNA